MPMPRSNIRNTALNKRTLVTELKINFASREGIRQIIFFVVEDCISDGYKLLKLGCKHVTNHCKSMRAK